ncbi:MAG: molybdopterin molybdotransferase MoeA [Deferribacterales bacterium]
MKVSRHKAKEILYSIACMPETEEVDVRDSYMRVLAEDILTERDYPDCRKSAVDGYAHIPGHSSYDQIGETGAGRKGAESISGDETVFVMTGGNVPDNALAVARVEDCKIENGRVVIPECKNGENINKIAEENSKGDVAASKGSVVTDGLFPVLFYLGRGRVKVYKRPKIGIFVTGDEILEAGEEYRKGFVYNTNKYILESMFRKHGFDFEYAGHVKDSKEDVAEAFEMMSEKYDIIISSGGISMGKYDYVKEVFNTCGYEILFSRTGIKPGSPLMTAKKDGCTFIGMPGYPAAFMTNLVFYIIPFLKKCYGYETFENEEVNVVTGGKTSCKEGRFDINRAVVRAENGVLTAFDAGTQKTSHFISFARVNALLLLDEETGSLDKGDSARAIFL